MGKRVGGPEKPLYFRALAELARTRVEAGATGYLSNGLAHQSSKLT